MKLRKNKSNIRLIGNGGYILVYDNKIVIYRNGTSTRQIASIEVLDRYIKELGIISNEDGSIRMSNWN